MNNFYLYRFQNTIRSTFIPWDKSNTFWALDWDIFRNFTTNVLARGAHRRAGLIALYKDTLRQANIAGMPEVGGAEILKDSANP